MEFDKSVVGSIVILLVAVLKIFNVNILPENLETTIYTLIQIGSAIVIYLNSKKVANTNVFGAIK